MTTISIPTVRTVPPAASQIATLTMRTLRDRWRSTVVWGFGLVLMAILQLSVYPSVAKSSESMQSFVNEWPEAFRQAFNLESYTTGAGFLNAEMLSMMIPLVLIGVATSGTAAATAGEEERGTADLLLSMPVSRTRVLLAKILAMLIGVVSVAVATLLTILIGAPLVDLDVTGANLVAGIAMTLLLALVFASVTLLLAAATGRRGMALGAGVALALGAFLLNALAPMASWLEPWQKASPFQWALGNNPLVNGIDWPMAVLMLVLCIALSTLAGVLYNRRDISGR